MMKKGMVSILAMASFGGWLPAAEISTFHAYVDSDLCARLMLGPINPGRVECSQKTYKEGSDAVLVRLSNNMVFSVNKTKMLKPLIGQLAEANGEAKSKSGEMKLASITPIDAKSIPAGDPARRLLDTGHPAANAPQLYEKIRHELAMMPYLTVYDFVSFVLVGSDVILTGWTVRQTNRSEAENRVKGIEGVEKLVNNIDILPLGSMDMQIRAATYANVSRMLGQYFWGSGSDIKIVVKNGDIILLGNVTRKGDYDLANIQANSVPGAFHVFNMLRVVDSQKGKKN